MPESRNRYDSELAEFKTKLRDSRIDAGLSLDDLANLMGSDKSPLSKIENGTRIPRLDMFFRILDALEVPASALLPTRLSRYQNSAEWDQLGAIFARLPEHEKETAVRYIRAMLIGVLEDVNHQRGIY